MWLYGDKEIKSHEDLFENCTDIVYLIEFEDGRQYVGKKAVKGWRTLPPLKGKKRKRKLLKELPFLNYEGSHGVEGVKVANKHILYQCSSRKASTYLENYVLFRTNAIFKDEFINLNIGGKFFDNDLNGLIEKEEFSEFS